VEVSRASALARRDAGAGAGAGKELRKKAAAFEKLLAERAA
jgi:hypothetical protein